MKQLGGWSGVGFACLAACVGGYLSAIAPLPVMVGLIAITVLFIGVRTLGLWRAAVAISVLTSVAHGLELVGGVPESVWYVTQFGALVVAALSALRQGSRPSLDAVSVAMFAFAVIVIASVAWSVAPTESGSQAVLFLVVFAFLGASYAVRWRNSVLLFGDISLVFWLLGFLAAASLVRMALDPVGAYGYYGRLQGVFANPNYAAIASAIAVSLGVWKLSTSAPRLRGWVILTVAISGSALVLTGSRGAIVAAVAGVVFAILNAGSQRLRSLIVLGGASTAILLGLFLSGVLFAEDIFDRGRQDSDFTSGRLQIWSDLLPVWLSRPVLGTGYRTIEILPESAGFAAHNIYYSVLIELGMIGFLSFAFLLVSILVRGHAARAAGAGPILGSAVAVAVIELTESSIFGFGGPTALVCWLALLSYAAAGRASLSAGRLASESFMNAEISPAAKDRRTRSRGASMPAGYQR